MNKEEALLLLYRWAGLGIDDRSTNMEHDYAEIEKAYEVLNSDE